MLRSLKEVQADDSVIGFYQAITLGAFYNQTLLETQAIHQERLRQGGIVIVHGEHVDEKCASVADGWRNRYFTNCAWKCVVPSVPVDGGVQKCVQERQFQCKQVRSSDIYEAKNEAEDR